MSGTDLGFGASERLDRLQTAAESGHAAPRQMLKLIGEVRQRRQTQEAWRGFVQIIADIDPDEDNSKHMHELVNQARALMGEPPLPGTPQ